MEGGGVCGTEGEGGLLRLLARYPCSVLPSFPITFETVNGFDLDAPSKGGGERPVLGPQKGEWCPGMMDGSVRLQTRKAGPSAPVRAAEEGGRLDARRIRVTRSIAVALAGRAGGPPVKRRKLGQVCPPTPGSSPPPWLCLPGWQLGPEDLFDPPRDPVT